MLLQSVEPQVVLPPCDYERETVNVIGRFAEDISPVMPYLNAIQPKALYNRSADILRFRFEGHQVTLQPHEMAAGGLADADEAIEMLARLQRLINDTWERRDAITPSTVERKRLKALDVYRLLPGTNCQACGEASCFVFANKLAARQVEVTLCAPLCTDPAHIEERAKMMALLEVAV
jgi:ArsR family metal-binding transcriptional regulator